MILSKLVLILFFNTALLKHRLTKQKLCLSGCGTGKYLGLAPESFILGSDSCLKISEIAAKGGHNVVTCDNQNLPFKDNCFDAVISVGVIHHFASAKRRIKALEELYRILQPGGKMLVYVWAFEQDERKVRNRGI